MAMRRRAPRRRGAALVEMAVVAPLFVLLLVGIIETARIGMVAQLLASAAREGCRVAVLNGSTQADVQARVVAALEGSGIEVGTVTPTPTDWATASAGDPITVRLAVPSSEVSWLGTTGLFPSVTLEASATLSSERP